MRKRDQGENHDSSDHIHQHENTTIVSRHKPEDQIKSDKMLHMANTTLWSRDMDNYQISWTAQITNEEVSRRMGTGRYIVRQFKTRTLQYLFFSAYPRQDVAAQMPLRN